MRCSFCATGKGGFARNLAPHEIMDQVCEGLGGVYECGWVCEGVSTGLREGVKTCGRQKGSVGGSSSKVAGS